MTNNILNNKNTIGFLIFFCTLSLLIFLIFMSSLNKANLVIEESLNIGTLGVEIRLMENIRLSYNTYELSPSDSAKLKLMFANNYNAENLDLSMKSNNCICFRFTDNEKDSNDLMVFINPVTKENWFYRFNNSDIIYTVDLNDEDVANVIGMQEKYSLLAKQMTKNEGDLKLDHKEIENDWIRYNFKLEYPNMTISEVYYEITHDGAGLSGSHLSDSEYHDGYINVKIYDDFKAIKLKVIIRGFEIINEEEILFQNIYQFQKNELQDIN